MITMENRVEPYAKLIQDSAITLLARIQSLREVYEISVSRLQSGEWSLNEVLGEVNAELDTKALSNYFLCMDTAEFR